MPEWFYEADGQSRGPVSAEQLKTLVGDGHVSADTLVWTETFGNDWRPVREADLFPQRPPVPPRRSAIGSPATSVDNPKPRLLTLSAWMIALYPIFLAIGELVLISVAPTTALQNGTGAVSFWLGAAAFLFAWRDANRIKAAGMNPENRWLVPFLLLTGIGYFIRRNRFAAGSMLLLTVFLASIVVYAILFAAILGEFA